MHDPYLYPETEILKNLLGIMDNKKLQEDEQLWMGEGHT